MPYSLYIKSMGSGMLLFVLALMMQGCASKQVALEPVVVKEKPIPMILDSDFGSSTDDLSRRSSLVV